MERTRQRLISLSWNFNQDSRQKNYTKHKPQLYHSQHLKGWWIIGRWSVIYGAVMAANETEFRQRCGKHLAIRCCCQVINRLLKLTRCQTSIGGWNQGEVHNIANQLISMIKSLGWFDNSASSRCVDRQRVWRIGARYYWLVEDGHLRWPCRTYKQGRYRPGCDRYCDVTRPMSLRLKETWFFQSRYQLGYVC